MEGGVPCPGCGAFVSFGDVAARGTCGSGDCETRLALDLVVRQSPSSSTRSENAKLGFTSVTRARTSSPTPASGTKTV